MGVSHHFPGGEIPEELHLINKEQGWDAFVKAVYSRVNDLGLTKEMLHNGFANNNGNLVDGIDTVLKKLHQTDHDLILSNDGKIVTSELPNEWGETCLNGGRNLCKGSAMKYFCKNKSYEEIKYFGDGKNDLCPALSLTENDKLYPRKDHYLSKLLATGDYEIKAKILP